MDHIKTDIVVVGGGIAGFAASIGAAAEGKKVLLIEKNNQLGGNATQANVGTVCGAYYRDFSENPKAVGYAFTKFFLSQLSQQSGTKPFARPEELIVIPYEWIVLHKLINLELQSKGVNVLNSAEVVSVERKDNCISTVTIEQYDKKIQVNPMAVIDCSGNGVISQLLGLEMLKDETYQASSQIFRVQNISATTEYSLSMAIKRSMVRLVNEKQWPESHLSLSVVPGSLRDNYVDLKLTLPDLITDNTSSNELVRKEAKKGIEEFFPVLKNTVNCLSDASIHTIFPQLGIRVLNRSKGKYILTEQDVLTGKKFDDGIAIGTWPIEEWGYDGKVNLQFSDSTGGYDIPASCLISSALSNLYFAGKNISATSRAVASARVMGTCLQTGYAAGRIASGETVEERQLTIQKLRGELSENRI